MDLVIHYHGLTKNFRNFNGGEPFFNKYDLEAYISVVVAIGLIKNGSFSSVLYMDH